MCLINDIGDDRLFSMQKITVVLGPACNISCRHCLQNSAKSFQWNYFVTDSCIDALVKWSRNVKVSSRLLFKKPMLLFYGGEPLLYYSLIREIVEKLEAFGFDFEKINLKLFTNGILLTEEMVDYFNRYGFEVVLSYDGPYEYAVRTTIASDENINLWKKIARRGVTSCLTVKNSDFLSTRMFLKNKFITEDISIEMIYVNWDMPVDIYDFPVGYFDMQLRKIETFYRYNKLDKSFLTFTKNYLGKITGNYRNITIASDGHILNNRFELESVGNLNRSVEYYCDSCEKKIVCPFAGKHNSGLSDCDIGSEFFRAYLKHKSCLEGLVNRDYDYLMLQDF